MNLNIDHIFDDKPPIGIEMILYNSKPSKDGTHLSVSAVNNVNFLKRIAKKDRKILCDTISSCFELLQDHLIKRIEQDNNVYD